jgi:hypothetical protein
VDGSGPCGYSRVTTGTTDSRDCGISDLHPDRTIAYDANPSTTTEAAIAASRWSPRLIGILGPFVGRGGRIAGCLP